VHAEVLAGGKATLADRADETVDVVDLLTRVHDKLVGTDRRQTSSTQLRHEQPAVTQASTRCHSAVSRFLSTKPFTVTAMTF